MLTTMNESERQQFEEMCKSTQKMEDVLGKIERALLGDTIYREKGLIERFSNHADEDEVKFDKIFKFQEKQQLWVGWVGVVVRTLVAALAVLGGWLISIFDK